MTRGVRKSHQINNERRRETQYKTDGETEYAWVTKVLGGYRLMVITMDKHEKMAIIRGNMRKREWVSLGDLVLISLRDFDEDKVDVIYRYTDQDIRQLKRAGEYVIDFDPIKGRFCEDSGDHQVVFQEDGEYVPVDNKKDEEEGNKNLGEDWLDLDAI